MYCVNGSLKIHLKITLVASRLREVAVIMRPPSLACKQHRASGCRDRLHSSRCVEIAAAKEGSSPTNQLLTTALYLSDQDRRNNKLTFQVHPKCVYVYVPEYHDVSGLRRSFRKASVLLLDFCDALLYCSIHVAVRE